MFPLEDEIRNSEGGTALDRPLPIQASGAPEGVTLLAQVLQKVTSNCSYTSKKQARREA